MKRFFFSLLIFFGFVVLFFLLFLGYIFLKYRAWEKDFNSNIKKEYVIEKAGIKSKEFNEKISKFSLSLEETAYLELDVQDIGGIIFSVLDSYVNENLKIEDMYILPSNSKWLVYVKIKYQDFSGWISTDINKDEVMSAQVYISDIWVGPFQISNINSNLVNTINNGIGDSIVTLNENGLVGRYIENIELTDDSVVLKGSRY